MKISYENRGACLDLTYLDSELKLARRWQSLCKAAVREEIQAKQQKGDKHWVKGLKPIGLPEDE